MNVREDGMHDWIDSVLSVARDSQEMRSLQSEADLGLTQDEIKVSLTVKGVGRGNTRLSVKDLSTAISRHPWS